MYNEAEKNMDNELEEEYLKFINDIIENSEVIENNDENEPNHGEYVFNQDNNYTEFKEPLKIAIDLISKGKTAEGILSLEAHLQRNEDPENWRILGKLHQENDQDKKAVACLLVFSLLIFKILKYLFYKLNYNKPLI